MDELREGRGQGLRGEVLLRGPDVRAHFAHGKGDAVAVAVGVGQQGGECGGFGRVVAVPDVVEEALAGFEGAVLAGDGVPFGRMALAGASLVTGEVREVLKMCGGLA